MGELQRQHQQLLEQYADCALGKAAWIRWYKEQIEDSRRARND